MKALASILVTLALAGLYHREAHGQSNNARRPESAGGSVCIAEVPPPDAGEVLRGNPARGYRASTYSIRIGARPPVDAPSSGAVRVSGLATGKKHLVRIYGDGVLVESFRFRFGSFATKELCLWYNSLYGTWSLWDSKDGGAKCRCGASGS